MSSSFSSPDDRRPRFDAPASGGVALPVDERAAASILRHHPDVVLRYDREGRIIFANEAAHGALGRAFGELVGQLARDVSPTSEIAARFAAARAEVFATGQPVAFEFRRAYADDVRWLEYRMLPEPDATGDVETVLAIGRDVTATRRATDALRASEARYRALVEATSQLVWRTGPEGRLDDGSAGWLELTGQRLEPGDRSSDRWLEVVHPDDRERAFDAWTTAVRTERPYETQYRVRRRDGAWRIVIARAAPVRDAEGQVVEWIGTITDVTDREHERARLAEAQHIARLGSWSWEASTGRVQLSEEWATAYGIDVSALHDPESVLHRVLAPGEHLRLEAQREVIDREQRPESEGRWRTVRPDGEERVLHTRSRWQFDAAGRRVAGSGTFQDVTEQVEVEARLVRQQALFEESQRLACVGSWELDLATDLVTWSDQMYRIAGLSPEERPLTRLRVSELIANDDLEYIRAQLAEGIVSGRNVQYEHRMVRPDGVVRHVVTHGRMVPGPDGRTARVVGSSQDVTEHRELELQVRQAQKMEALGLLAGGVAHDFNNLLTVILGSVGFAREDLHAEHPAQADLHEATAAAERARVLVRQLLAFSRRQIRRPRTLDLRDTVRHAEHLLRRLLPDDVALDVTIGAVPCAVLGDASQLEQVMMNLVMNARDAIAEARVAAASEPGSAAPPVARVTIEAEHLTIPAGSPFTAARDGGPLPEGAYAALVVRDTGAGMSATTLARVFEPFFTTKPEGKGTGLGLATVFSIVAQHEGAIRVDSAPGKGATFTVLLPAIETEAFAAEQPASRPASGTETILLVEDDDFVRAMAMRILERDGYRVITAHHGADALRAWRAHAHAIDGVVTDLRMPVMDGRALAEALRAERPELPVVLMSGAASGSGVDVAAADDRHVFLEKPFTADTLLMHVRAALDRRRGT